MCLKNFGSKLAVLAGPLAILFHVISPRPLPGTLGQIKVDAIGVDIHALRVGVRALASITETTRPGTVLPHVPSPVWVGALAVGHTPTVPVHILTLGGGCC